MQKGYICNNMQTQKTLFKEKEHKKKELAKLERKKERDKKEEVKKDTAGQSSIEKTSDKREHVLSVLRVLN